MPASARAGTEAVHRPRGGGDRLRRARGLHHAGADFTAISEERGDVVFGDADLGGQVDRPDRRLAQRPPHVALVRAQRRDRPAPAWPTSSSPSSTTSGPARNSRWSTAPARTSTATGSRPRARLRARADRAGRDQAGPDPAADRRTGREGVSHPRVGSLALTLCYVAAARFDGMLSGRPARSVDVAAAQLHRARGRGERQVRSPRPLRGPARPEARYDVAAGLDEEILGTLLRIQRAAPAETV